MKKPTIKKQKLNPSYERNIGTMKLLVSYHQFQQIVVEMRKKLEIPNDGFPTEVPAKKWVAWEDNMMAKSDAEMSSKLFKEQEERIKQNLTEKTISIKMANLQLGLLYEKIPLNYLYSRISFMLDKFNLPIHYRRHIEKYIISGEISAPGYNYAIGPYQASQSPKGVRRLPVTIYTRLDQKETEELKRTIDIVGRKLPKYNVIGEIDGKLTVEKWYENRERIDETDNRAYLMTDEEIAETALGNRNRGKDVYNIQRSMKNLRDKRFNGVKK